MYGYCQLLFLYREIIAVSRGPLKVEQSVHFYAVLELVSWFMVHRSNLLKGMRFRLNIFIKSLKSGVLNCRTNL